MYMFIHALILALLLPATGGERERNTPACRAELKGLNLLTVVDLPGGITVEGPWRVVHTGETKDGETQFVMLATLDHVVERDALTGERHVIPFPQPVSLAFEGPTQRELVHHAAQLWCTTVMRAQEKRTQGQLPPSLRLNTKVAAL